MNYIEGKVRYYYLLLLTSDFHLIDRITQNEILSYRTYVLPFYAANHTHYLHHTGTHHHRYSPSSYSSSPQLQVTIYNMYLFQGINGVLSDMRTCGDSPSLQSSSSSSQSNYFRKKEKQIDRSKPCGDCVTSHTHTHPIKETTREIRYGTYCK